jgi:hypothetical protein
VDPIGHAVAQWRDVANALGIKRSEQDEMADAFLTTPAI